MGTVEGKAAGGKRRGSGDSSRSATPAGESIARPRPTLRPISQATPACSESGADEAAAKPSGETAPRGRGRRSHAQPPAAFSRENPSSRTKIADMRARSGRCGGLAPQSFLFAQVGFSKSEFAKSNSSHIGDNCPRRTDFDSNEGPRGVVSRAVSWVAPRVVSRALS